MPKNTYQTGIVIDNLPSFVTQEILFKELKNKQITGALVSKVTNVNQKTLKKLKEDEVPTVKAFVGFDSAENAIQARNALSHTKVLEKLSDKISRCALIVKKDTQNENYDKSNYIIEGLPEDITQREFDETIQKYGPIVSSAIIRGKGFISFLRSKDGQKFFKDCLDQLITFKGQNIKVNKFIRQPPKQTKNTLYFKNFTQQGLNLDSLQELKQQIEKHFREIFAEIEEQIKTIIVNVSSDHQKPYAFVNFETDENAQKAKQIYESPDNKERKYFDFVAYPDPKYKQSELKTNFIYIKPLKMSVTERQLTEVLNKVLETKGGVESVKVTIPSHSHYKDTKFATVITKESNLVEYLKSSIKNEDPYFSQEFLDLFSKESRIRNTICSCFPKQRHQAWLQKRQQKYFTKAAPQQQPPISIQQRLPFVYNPSFPFMGFQMPQAFPYLPGAPHIPPMAPYQPYQQFQQFQQFQGQGYQYQQNRPSRQLPRQHQPHYQQQGKSTQPRQQQYQQGGNYYNNNRVQSQSHQYRGQQQQQQDGRYQQQRGPKQQQQYQNRQPQFHQGGQRRQQQDQQQQGRQQYQQPQQQQKQQQQQQPVQPKKVVQPKQIDPLEQIKKNIENFKKQDKNKQIQVLGQLLYPKAFPITKNKPLINKIIQMIVDLETFTVEEIIETMQSQETLKERIQESEELLSQQNQ